MSARAARLAVPRALALALLCVQSGALRASAQTLEDKLKQHVREGIERSRSFSRERSMPSRTCCLSLSSSVWALARSAPDCTHSSASASARGTASLAARALMVRERPTSAHEALPAALDQPFVRKI